MPFVLDPTRLRASRRYTSGTPPISQAPISQYRVAAMALFALIGAVFGSWASRIPNITADLALDPTTLGLLLLCVSLGALASMQLTGHSVPGSALDWSASLRRW